MSKMKANDILKFYEEPNLKEQSVFQLLSLVTAVGFALKKSIATKYPIWLSMPLLC